MVGTGQPVAKVTDSIVAGDGRAIGVFAEVTRFAEIEAMRQQIEQTLGQVDILVANAGGSFAQPKPLEDLSEEDWHASLDGNLTATFLTLKSFLPTMKQRGKGVIITVSSAAGRRPHQSSPIAYAAAKAGVQMLTRDAAAQTGPFGVRVNCIAPETILTERNREYLPEQVQARLADHHPVRRLGTPRDVAEAALFMVGDRSSWMTGITLDIAGGAVML